jgi:hypothetical protein
MGTDKKKLARGLKYVLMALPLLILGPVLITMGFKALKMDQGYLWLILGIVIASTAVVLGFFGLKIILSAFFDDD